jgi:hypothetical protein
VKLKMDEGVLIELEMGSCNWRFGTPFGGPQGVPPGRERGVENLLHPRSDAQDSKNPSHPDFPALGSHDEKFPSASSSLVFGVAELVRVRVF